MRSIIVAANWKMNKNLQDGIDFIESITQSRPDRLSCQIVINTPFIHLPSAGQLLKDHPSIHLGAQNVHYEKSGAFTGEVSADMLKSCLVDYVVVGHSERRAYSFESDQLILAKIKATLHAEITPIYCCGEPLEVRDAGQHVEYVLNQLQNSIFHLTADEVRKIVIAYEPIWAIGTGRTAESAQAQEMHAAIRSALSASYGTDVAAIIPILYGGSCNPGNASELFALPDVDGGLIGGASLKIDDFLALIDIAERQS